MGRLVVLGILLASVGLGAVSAGALAADLDGDGLSSIGEVSLGTEPMIADTDGDGLPDGREVAIGTDPLDLDTDGDGLPDGREVEIGTDSLGSDTDGDGFPDGREVETGTDPLGLDTDGDGLDDTTELSSETDPLDPDTDGDRLNDGAEVNDYGTDPLGSDTDGDGLSDGREVEIGTDPLDLDTDGDGLPDGAEVTAAERLPGADPLRMDVFVEIDHVEGETFPAAERDRVVGSFADAPISNRDGSTGISLHLLYDDAVPGSERTYYAAREGAWNDLGDYRAASFDNRGFGYHYVVIVGDVRAEDRDVAGLATNGSALVQSYDQYDNVTGHVFMHELGHSIGLHRSAHDGIDSRSIPADEYPSVMNYELNTRRYGYSDGSHGPRDHDDWGFLESAIYTPNATLLAGSPTTGSTGDASAEAERISRNPFDDLLRYRCTVSGFPRVSVSAFLDRPFVVLSRSIGALNVRCDDISAPAALSAAATWGSRGRSSRSPPPI